jgi:hypothetical protein
MGVAVPNLKWTVLYARAILDLGLFVTTVVFVFTLTATMKKNAGSVTPFLFDVYHMMPYQGLDDVGTFYTTSVLDHAMCTNATAGCTTQAALLTALQTSTGCLSGAAPHSPICADCVSLYATRLYTAVNALTDHKADKNIAADIDVVEPLRDELEACIARSGGKRTVQFLFKTSPWLQLLLWNGLALIYTVSALALSLANEYDAQKSAGYGVMLVATTVVALYMSCMLYMGTGWEYDIRFSVVQLIGGCLLYPLLQSAYQKHEGNSDRTFTLTFGMFMVTAAPSIAVIMNALNCWVEFDMLNLSVTVFTTFFVLCMLDDLLSVYWSKTPLDNESAHIEHWYMHMYLLAVTLLLVVCFAALSLPAPPFGDKLSGNMFFVMLLVFTGVYAIIPAVLYENKIADTMGIVTCKEMLEIAFRLVAFTVMAHMYSKGVPF